MSDLLMVIATLLAFLIIPILLLLAFIKPAMLKLKTNKNPSGDIPRKQFLIGLLVAWIVSMGIGVATAPATTPTDAIDLETTAQESGINEDDYTVHENGAISFSPPDEVEDAVEVEAVAIPVKEVETPVVHAKTFGITPDEFGRRFMEQANEVGLGENVWPSDGFNIKEGTVNDVFTVILGDDIAMNGIVDKNGELKGITYIMGKTDNGEEAAMNMMMMSGLTARALNPDLPKEQTAGVLTELMVDAVQQFSDTGDGKSSKVVDDVKYSVIAGNGIGLWVSFEPAE